MRTLTFVDIRIQMTEGLLVESCTSVSQLNILVQDHVTNEMAILIS